LGAAGALWYAAASRNGGNGGRPLSDLPDTAQTDSTRVDSLTAADAPRVDRQGFDLLKSGEYGQAADLFRQAMELDPTRAEYKDHLAFALINQQRYTEAVALLEDATRQDPNYDLSYSHLGNARLALGDTLGAVVALRRFLDVSVNQHDRAEVQTKLNELLAPRPAPAPAPADTTPPADTVSAPPADSIRIGPPR
jgi:tetratricopeptide (TPR) repeat protein